MPKPMRKRQGNQTAVNRVVVDQCRHLRVDMRLRRDAAQVNQVLSQRPGQITSTRMTSRSLLSASKAVR